jgi:flagellar hook-length control protein FliK
MPPPAHISTQIRNALEVSGSRDIEIRLDPEELGRVRIVLSPKDGGMSVVFFSDRPEVLDLMRRNSGLLESDFSDIGYESASFSFQQDRNEPHQTTQDTQGQWEMEPPVDQPISHQPQSIGKDTRLDLRF